MPGVMDEPPPEAWAAALGDGGRFWAVEIGVKPAGQGKLELAWAGAWAAGCDGCGAC